MSYDVLADSTPTDATETPTVDPEGGSDSDDESVSTSGSSSSISAEELAALTAQLSTTLQEKNELQTTLNQLDFKSE